MYGMITPHQRKTILHLLDRLDMGDDEFAELLGRTVVRPSLDALSHTEAGHVTVALQSMQREKAREGARVAPEE